MCTYISIASVVETASLETLASDTIVMLSVKYLAYLSDTFKLKHILMVSFTVTIKTKYNKK